MPILKCKIFQNHKKFKIIHLVTNGRCTFKSSWKCQSIVQEKKNSILSQRVHVHQLSSVNWLYQIGRKILKKAVPKLLTNRQASHIDPAVWATALAFTALHTDRRHTDRWSYRAQIPVTWRRHGNVTWWWRHVTWWRHAMCRDTWRATLITWYVLRGEVWVFGGVGGSREADYLFGFFFVDSIYSCFVPEIIVILAFYMIPYVRL